MYPFNRFLQRGGNPTSKNWNERKSWLAGCEVANEIPLSLFIGFAVGMFASCTNTELFSM